MFIGNYDYLLYVFGYTCFSCSTPFYYSAQSSTLSSMYLYHPIHTTILHMCVGILTSYLLLLHTCTYIFLHNNMMYVYQYGENDDEQISLFLHLKNTNNNTNNSTTNTNT